MTDFGRDTLCIDSLRTGRHVTGVRRLAQRCYHRLITPRGMLRGGTDEGNFGLDLAGQVGSSVTDAQRTALPRLIESELKKEAQVATVRATVTWTTSTSGEVSADVTVEVTSSLGPFELVMSVDQVSAKLLRLVA